MTQSKNSCCEGCGLELPIFEGPTHPYVLSSPACWALYGQVLAREYEDPCYHKVHRLTVDAYALQHPGNKDPRAIRSVMGHLASLYLIFEYDFSQAEATKATGTLVKGQVSQFVYLEPPNSLGAMTVQDAVKANGVNQHITTVEQWAKSVLSAWKGHHKFIHQCLVNAGLISLP